MAPSFTSPAFKKLLSFKKGDKDSEFDRQSIHLLLKILKKGEIGALIKALRIPGQQSTCITLSRPFVDHLQMPHRKGPPQVISCRLWRWPELESLHQIRNLCTDLKCINPYHYERVNSPVLPPGHPLLSSPAYASIQGFAPYGILVLPRVVEPGVFENPNTYMAEIPPGCAWLPLYITETNVTYILSGPSGLSAETPHPAYSPPDDNRHGSESNHQTETPQPAYSPPDDNQHGSDK